MGVEIRLLEQGDEAVLERVAEDTFDDPIVPAAARVFLADPRHHIAVAIDDGVVVGFVSAVHYAHPDKPAPELWINEVGVAPSHQRQGLARRLMDAMNVRGRALGCTESWVLTDRSNDAAMRLYATSGGEVTMGDQVMFTFRLDPG